jgi:ATP-dependent exoDNAse (exonuclease V) beta subunit
MAHSLNVYSASAGSGKTFILVVEYIKLLLQDTNNYRSTLAVTFTNKATAEMKDRILDQLYNLWQNLPSSKPYLNKIKESINLDDSIIRQRAGEALIAILHDYTRFRIQTIDSFFQSILKNLAHELELTTNLQTDLDDDEALNSAVDHIMEDLQNRPKIKEWMTQFVIEQIESDKGWNVIKDIKKFAKAIFDTDYLKQSEKLNTILKDYNFIPRFRKQLRDSREAACSELSRAVTSFKEEMQSCGISYNDISHGNYIDTYIKNIDNAAKSNEFGTYDSMPSQSILGYINDTNKWIKRADQNNKQLVDKIDQILRPALENLEQKRADCYNIINSSALTDEHLNKLRLLNAIDIEVTEMMNEANRFLLSKTPILLNQLISPNDAPFVFERMGGIHNHAMIDEFQDTSTIQWENFKSLLLDIMSNNNGNLIVGDIKQSIYRWRGGDWRLLQNIENEMPHGTVQVSSLDTNYRSASRIVRFNNELYQNMIDDLDQMDDDHTETFKAIYGDVAQNCPPNIEESGYVDIILFPDKTNYPANMLEDLGNKIGNLHTKGLPYNQMAILVRRNDDSKAIIDYFAEKMPDVPIVSDEAFLLSSSTAVKVLISAMHYLSDNDIVSAAYLKSQYSVSTNQEEASLHQIWTGDNNQYLPQEFIERQKELSIMPLYELQEELIQIFGLENMEGQAAYLMTYLDNVMKFIKDGNATISSLLSFWDEKLYKTSITSPDVEGIRILTIHKAKGLEFHTVLIPMCQWKMADIHPGSRMWCIPSDEPFNQLPLAPVTIKKADKQSIYKDEYKKEILLRRVEDVNLLYVATTRAKENLYIWGLVGKDNDVASLLRKSLNKMEIQDTTDDIMNLTIGTPVTTFNDKEKSKSIKLQMESYANHVEFRQSNPSKEFIASLDDDMDGSDKSELLQETYIQEGKLLHKIFSSIKTYDDIESVLNDIEANGLIESSLKKKTLKNIIIHAFSNKTAADWFDKRWMVINECAIVNINPTTQKMETKRPDRVIQTDSQVIVIDFKFGKQHKYHQDQVADYMNLLKKIYPNKLVEGYLWYIYENKIEEVK